MMQKINGQGKQRAGSHSRTKKSFLYTRKGIYGLLTAIVAVITALLYLYANYGNILQNIKTDGEQSVDKSAAFVRFIDVGQGDSILINSGGAAVLIDAGEEEYSSEVIRQISDQGITKLDVLVGTHPHSDHIGGLDKVIEAFDIGEFYMPRVTNNTRQFEEVIMAAAAKSLRITAPIPGDALELAGGLMLYFLGPVFEDAGYINDSSIIIKAVFAGEGKQEYSFLFAADAESLAERLLLENNADIGAGSGADVLKVGHHGSATSTGRDFLAVVDPAYAVIQCGAGNPYGHPDPGVLDLLDEQGATVMRTDLSGTITFYLNWGGADDEGRYIITTERGG